MNKKFLDYLYSKKYQLKAQREELIDASPDPNSFEREINVCRIHENQHQIDRIEEIIEAYLKT